MAALGCAIEVVISPGDRQADAVRTLSGPVEFEYCVARRGQYEQYCEVFGHAFPSKWYVVPSRNGLVPPAERYDLGLDKVVQYARGASSHQSIARRINVGIAAELCYHPAEYPPGHVLFCYYWPPGVMCTANADLLIYLCKTAGINAWKVFTWGGASLAWLDRYYPKDHLGDDWARVSIRLRAPANEMAEENPHFLYHAVTAVAGILCDPSYGAPWLPDGTSCHEGCYQQISYDWPGHASTWWWECDHEVGPGPGCP